MLPGQGIPAVQIVSKLVTVQGRLGREDSPGEELEGEGEDGEDGELEREDWEGGG